MMNQNAHGTHNTFLSLNVIFFSSYLLPQRKILRPEYYCKYYIIMKNFTYKNLKKYYFLYMNYKNNFNSIKREKNVFIQK